MDIEKKLEDLVKDKQEMISRLQLLQQQLVNTQSNIQKIEGAIIVINQLKKEDMPKPETKDEPKTKK